MRPPSTRARRTFAPPRTDRATCSWGSCTASTGRCPVCSSSRAPRRRRRGSRVRSTIVRSRRPTSRSSSVGSKKRRASWRVSSSARTCAHDSHRPRRPRPRQPFFPTGCSTTRTAYSLVEVTPRTGRHHQIRLQLSAAGHPVVGDLKYHAPKALPDQSIALHAARLSFPHPVRDEIVTISAPPPGGEPWARFRDAIAKYFV